MGPDPASREDYPQMSKGPDFSQVARRVADQATGEDADKRRDPAAVSLGRKGGRARADKMTPEQRSEAASHAARIGNEKRRTATS